MSYTKPMILVNDDLAEGIYAASGAVAATDSGIKCDSVYMKGVYQAPDNSNWAPGETRSYRKQFGCLGCPAFRDNGCGLQSDYIDSGKAASYDVDNGNRKPSWERMGYDPDDGVTDWAM